MNIPFPAGLELATILRDVPECFLSRHRILTIQTAYRLGWANRLWSKAAAIRLAVQTHMEAVEGHGRGSKSERRLARILLDELMADIPLERLTEAEIDEMARLDAMKRKGCHEL